MQGDKAEEMASSRNEEEASGLEAEPGSCMEAHSSAAPAVSSGLCGGIFGLSWSGYVLNWRRQCETVFESASARQQRIASSRFAPRLYSSLMELCALALFSAHAQSHVTHLVSLRDRTLASSLARPRARIFTRARALARSLARPPSALLRVRAPALP